MAEQLASPYFLYLHYVDPHDPYQPELPWGVTQETLEDHAWTQPRRLRGLEPTESQLQSLVDQYDGEIRELDRELRRLIEGLRAQGQLDNTLVIVTSDHGEEFGEHGGLTHGRTLFEEVVAVPLIVFGLPTTGQKEAIERRSVSQVDIAATLLEALGLEQAPDHPHRGRSLWSSWTGGPSANSPIPSTGHYLHLDLDGRSMLGSITGATKTLWMPRANDPLGSAVFYDLANDPLEQIPRQIAGRNLLKEANESGDTARPTAERSHLLARLLAHHNSSSELAPSQSERTLDKETELGLRLLGYIDEATTDNEPATGATQAAQSVGRRLPTHVALPARYRRSLQELDASPTPGREAEGLLSGNRGAR